MKAAELRIGNYYRSLKFDRPVKLDLSDLYELCVKADGATDDPPIDEMFEPIPLTGEWLIKLGFEKMVYEAGSVIYDKNCSRIRYYSYNETFEWQSNDGFDEVQLEYVHQLQNLYFAMTGEELVFKLIK